LLTTCIPRSCVTNTIVTTLQQDEVDDDDVRVDHAEPAGDGEAPLIDPNLQNAAANDNAGAGQSTLLQQQQPQPLMAQQLPAASAQAQQAAAPQHGAQTVLVAPQQQQQGQQQHDAEPNQLALQQQQQQEQQQQQASVNAQLPPLTPNSESDAPPVAEQVYPFHCYYTVINTKSTWSTSLAA
jgi:hypothetical protein